MKNKHSAPFVAILDAAQQEKLKVDLSAQGFSFHTAPYACFCAKKQGISCTLYTSGKLVVQGRAKEEFLQFYLEPELLQDLSFSHPELAFSPSARIGMDEAGKGDFFGPLCVAALFAPENSISKLLQLGVKDSKKLQDSQVLEISRSLKENFSYKILTLMPKTYNRLYERYHNLNLLLAWAHATVLEELSHKTHCKEALLDQFANPNIMTKILSYKHLDVHLTQRTHAEEDPVVAGASILARAAFVEGIEELERITGLTLPKGASLPVKNAAKMLVKERGLEMLYHVSKHHFKTTAEVS